MSTPDLTPDTNRATSEPASLAALITAERGRGLRLDALGATGETERALDALARGGNVLTPLLRSEVLSCHGADAAPFLHGQVANDVNGLPSGGANHTLLLNHKGHALAEAGVLRQGRDELLLIVDDGRGSWAKEELERHIIFDEVKLAPVDDMMVLTLQGKSAGHLLGDEPETQRFTTFELNGVTVTAYPRRRSAAGGYDLLVDADKLEPLLEGLLAAGAVIAGERALDAVRVTGKVPSAASEGGDGVLPQEAGLEAALSYRKGCYLGQEIMARIEARGKLRRGLRQLTLSELPEVGDPSLRGITSGGRRVGMLGTVAEFAGEVRALAVLRDDLGADVELEVAGVSAWPLQLDASQDGVGAVDT